MASGKWFTFAALAMAALAAGCEGPADDAAEAQADEISTRRAIGWAAAAWPDRKAWYTTAQGSFLVEEEIFLALERADSTKPFASPVSLEPLGFLYPPAGETDLTSDPRLPLGVVRDSKPGDARSWVGFTCAACHTGVIDTPDKKTRLLVDGGQGFLNLSAFLRELRSALDAAATGGPKQARLCGRLADPSDCSARVVAARDRVAGIVERNRDGASPEGPGRVDALTREANEIFSHQLASEPTYPLAAPISIPQVWDAPRLSCPQTNCLPLDPLSRNVAEQIAVFGETKVHKVGNRVVTKGTAKLENLYTLERSLLSLESPRWSAMPLPPIDGAKAARGATLFSDHCAGCHTEPYRSDAPAGAFVVEEVSGRRSKIWRATAATLDEVGTDSAFIDSHFSRFVSDPLLIDVFNRKLWSVASTTIGVNPENPFAAVLVVPAVGAAKAGLALKGFYDFWGNPLEIAAYGALTDAVIEDELARMEPDAAKRAALKERYTFSRDPQGSATDIQQYKARPLDGIAFTAPFGHNGAWPTLRDVLEAPAARPRSFVVRPGSFDPAKVGLDTRPAQLGEELFVFDTAKPGNGAGGHTYGTGLAPADKAALLEYLKSI